MKRLLLFLLSAITTGGTALADAPDIIYTQPEGTLRIYERHGKTIDDDLAVKDQTGTMAVVYAAEGQVYLQDPVSGYTMGGSWVKGTLSDDGTTITVPLGQYLDYTRSFDMAYQLQMLHYDAEQNDYVPSETVTEVTYSVAADGTIALNGTSQQDILGFIFRTFGNPQGSSIGQDFMYLNNTWGGAGDFASYYTPTEQQALQAPDGLETTAYYVTSAEFDGAQYGPYNRSVLLGWDGDDLWVQGLSWLMPAGWATGTREDDTVVITTGQFMGTVEGVPLYLHGASLGSDGNFTIKDIVLTVDGDELTTYDYVFVSTSATALEYVNFYMGLTLSPRVDTLVEAPALLSTIDYRMTFRDAYNQTGEQQVKIGTDGTTLYIGGIWAALPEAWVQGTLTDGQVVVSLPQYIGTYTAEDTVYPIYVTAFNTATGELYRRLTLDYDPATGILQNASAAVSIGINKTGYLSVQDFVQPVFTPLQWQGISTTLRDSRQPTAYDLKGMPAASRTRALHIIGGRKVLQK